MSCHVWKSLWKSTGTCFRSWTYWWFELRFLRFVVSSNALVLAKVPLVLRCIYRLLIVPRVLPYLNPNLTDVWSNDLVTIHTKATRTNSSRQGVTHPIPTEKYFTQPVLPKVHSTCNIQQKWLDSYAIPGHSPIQLANPSSLDMRSYKLPEDSSFDSSFGHWWLTESPLSSKLEVRSIFH